MIFLHTLVKMFLALILYGFLSYSLTSKFFLVKIKIDQPHKIIYINFINITNWIYAYVVCNNSINPLQWIVLIHDTMTKIITTTVIVRTISWTNHRLPYKWGFLREPNFAIFFQIGGIFLAVLNYLIFTILSFNQNQILAYWPLY